MLCFHAILNELQFVCLIFFYLSLGLRNNPSRALVLPQPGTGVAWIPDKHLKQQSGTNSKKNSKKDGASHIARTLMNIFG